MGRKFQRPIIVRPIASGTRDRTQRRSVRPYQLLQFQQVAGLPLPVRDAELPDWIAGAMQEYQRHQPALQLELQIRARKTESLKQAPHATRYSAGHEDAGAKQVVFVP